ncbi:bifunctional nuclease domain-containing protein [Rhodocyclaceae bacterium SMB388]
MTQTPVPSRKRRSDTDILSLPDARLRCGPVLHAIARLLPVLLALLMLAPAIGARELALPSDALIPVELATVAVLSGTDTPVVLLREPESGDMVPIFIGPPEARAILLAQQGITPPRPMTHDLLRDVIDKLSGTLESVVVDALRDGIYHGALEVRVGPDARLVRIDARPSDALALAARTGAAIRVAPSVLHGGAGLQFDGLARDQVATALGITVVEATPALRDALRLPDTPGVLVTAVTGLAAYAGMNPGTLVVEVNGDAPDKPMVFLELVRRTVAGERAQIVYWYAGEERTLSLPTTVPPRPNQRAMRL